MTHLVIESEGSFEVAKVVVVCFLEMLSDGGEYPSQSILPPQVVVPVPHMDQIPCPVLIRLHHDAIGVAVCDE